MENKIELGSEFHLSLNTLWTVKDNLFDYLKNYTVQWYDYGRSALRHIPIKKGKTILLPEFICESVTACFEKDSLRFYKIDAEFHIDILDLMNKIDETVGYIYVAHYFGFLQKPDVLTAIRELADRKGITVIEDTTQSLFSDHVPCGRYMTASVRKWMAVPMGGILYTDWGGVIPDQEQCPYNNNHAKAYGMILKDMFLKTGYDANSEYRKIFVEAEKEIDAQTDVCRLSDLSRFLIGCVDVNELIRKRKHNAHRLAEGLERIGIRSIRPFEKDECPLVYPIRVKNRDAFRRYLIEHRIYCAVHWPFDGIAPEERENAIDNAGTLISLPIDQRYSDREIDYMLDVIDRYGGESLF